MKNIKQGGPLVPRVGLSATSPRPTAQPNPALRAFRCYPCRVVLLWALLIASSSAFAQVMSLDTVLATIDRRNPMLQQYNEKASAYREYTAGAKSWMAPMVGAGTFMTPYPGQQLMEARDKGSIMISVEQQIPNPARLQANQNYLASRAAIEEKGRAVQFNSLRAEAKTLYYQWLVAEEKVRVLRENERALQLMLKLARLRYPYNQGSLGNIYKTEGRLLEVQNMLLMAQGDIDEKSYRLKSLMTLPAQTPLQVDTTLQITFQPFASPFDTAALSAQRSDIQQLDRTIEAMQLNQQLQRYQAKPDFKIRFDHMQPLGDMPVQFTAMAMISIPIAPWSSKMYKAEVRGMHYDIQAMKRERESVLVETQGMLAGMSAQIARMQQQVDNYQHKIVPALQKNYDAALLAYEENREQLPVVIDGWEALNMAQVEYLNKREALYIMIVTYEKQAEK
ncbi:TolC family protein [Chryseolinea lacunae]|uniref:TolC family protein n=1 Tax=Chryseolinea lacunae TaxID=2801331 RepID=A0ABS1L0Y7_9BACT|nr:TolC family protein [Chryseolinea lacunae]MBL0745250.1 TolC family protein [Chryseolinea lacunae]